MPFYTSVDRTDRNGVLPVERKIGFLATQEQGIQERAVWSRWTRFFWSFLSRRRAESGEWSKKITTGVGYITWLLHSTFPSLRNLHRHQDVRARHRPPWAGCSVAGARWSIVCALFHSGRSFLFLLQRLIHSFVIFVAGWFISCSPQHDLEEFSYLKKAPVHTRSRQ